MSVVGQEQRAGEGRPLESRTKDQRGARWRSKLYDSQPHQEPKPRRLKGPVTWDKAAGSYSIITKPIGTRSLKRQREGADPEPVLRGRKLTEIDAPAILRYVAHRRAQGKAANTVNVELATLRRALRLAQELGHLASVPVIRTLRPAPPRKDSLRRASRSCGGGAAR